MRVVLIQILFYLVPVIIIIVEGIILDKNSRLNFIKALGIALLINIVPIIVWFASFIIMIPLDGSAIEMYVGALTLFGIPVGSYAIIRYVLMRIDYSGNASRSAIGMLSIYFMFILIAISMPPLLNARRAKWESRAKGTLRAIASTEQEYQSKNDKRLFGSFEELQDQQMIAAGYTKGDIINEYSIAWMVNNISTVVSEKFPSGVSSSYSVIAWPRDTRPGFLSTFAVADDQIVRVYNPDNGNSANDIATWDPIL